MASQIRFRRDTQTNWTTRNPTLGNGEPAYDTTNRILKIGDGTSTFANLAFFTTNAYVTSYVTWSNISGKPTLSTVATSGSYADLSDTPTTVGSFTNDAGYLVSANLTPYATITYVNNYVTWSNVANKPTTVSSFTNDAGYLVSANLTPYATLTYVNNYVTWSNVSGKPTAVSSFTNDAGYLVSADLSSYATQSYVGNAIANLVASAPSTLDTLNEIASALGNDPNLSTTLTTSIATKASSSDLTTANTNMKAYVDSGLSTKANTSSLATVSTSGSYTDLINKPTTVSSFTNDAGYLVSANLTGYATENYVTSYVTWSNVSGKPTAVSSFTNDAGYLVSANLTPYATITYVNNYVTWSNVSGKPTAVSSFTNDANYATTTEVTTANTNMKAYVDSGLSTKANISSLATVATSGSYLDLSNKPTIPTHTSNLTNDSGYLTSANLTGYATETYVINYSTWSNISNKPTFATVATSGSYTDLINKPAAVSSFTNDAGYLVSANLTGYATENYVTSYVTWSNVSGKPSFATVATSGAYSDLSGRPTAVSSFTNDAGYLVSANLTGYATENYVTSYVTWSNVSGKPTFATVATSGAYSDLSGRPTAVSSFTNDANYANVSYVNQKVSDLVASAPTTLDTLNEIATALGNDPNLATTLTTQISLKANTSSLSTVATSGSYTDLSNKPNLDLYVPYNGTGITVTGNISAGNLSGTNIVGTLTTASQTNITAVGTLGSLSVTGNVTPGGISTVGNVTAGYFIGNGSQLTGLPAGYTNANVADYLPTYTGNIGAGNINATNLYGTIRTAAQTNITSVGTLTGLTLSGTLTGTTINAATIGNSGASLVGGLSNAVTFNNGGAGSASGTTYNGNSAITISHNTIGAAPQAGNSSIVTVGTITSGTWQGSEIATAYTAAKVTSVNGSTGAVSGLATTAGTLAQFASTTSAQLAGVISDETGSGALVFATSPTFSTDITVPAIIKSGSTGVGNIGSSGNTFNTVFAKATTAQYADLAEIYKTDRQYPVGTVVAVGGDEEVTACSAGQLAIGAISEKPAYLMNSSADGQAVALKGRVPVLVVGPVRKGQRLIADNNGCARAVDSADPNVFAVALVGKNSNEPELIEAIIL